MILTSIIIDPQDKNLRKREKYKNRFKIHVNINKHLNIVKQFAIYIVANTSLSLATQQLLMTPS